MTTIQDVARRAGVGAITVSRVINHAASVRPETRARVEAAIAETGYVPNLLARSLRSRRTDTLALLVTDITNPFFTTIARGVEDTANAAGYTVIFGNTDESLEKEQAYLTVVLQKQVDGVLLVPAQSQAQSVERIQRSGIPLVVIDRRVPNADVDLVTCDSEDGAYQLTRYLASLGHRRMRFIGGPRGISTADDRAAGFQRAITEAGIGTDEADVRRGALTVESGAALTAESMRQQPRPTALVAGNNFITIGAMKALQALQLRVPEDVALVGFDDLPSAMVAFPFFTVIAQPAYAMGCRATDLLLARLNGQPLAARQEIVLPTEFILRASSGGRVD